jgi:site-specific DNA recombinase
MRRIAIYARYSTDKQDSRSCEDQIRRCRGFSAPRDWQTVDVYSDAAVSGSHTDRRELQRLLADSKKGRFESVLVDDLTRLSRDFGAGWRIVFEDLADIGVSVVDCETGHASDDDVARTLFGIKGLFADQYIQTLRRQTHRGLTGRALAGFATGGKTYGFTTIVEASPPDPTHPRKLRAIHQDESKVVLRIFEMFASGGSPKKIAATLNAEGIPAPHDGGKGNKRSRGWGHTTIRHMLRNENYVGVWVWNRHRFKQIRGTNSHRHVPRPESEHVRKELPDLRVVPADLWTRTQDRIGPPRTPQSARVGTGTRPGNLFAGLLKCGCCGGAVGVVSRHWKNGVPYTNLGCGTRRSRGAAVCSNNRTVSARKLTVAVTAVLRDRLTAPDLVERFIAGVKKRYESPKPSHMVELEKRLPEAERRVRNVTEALAKVGVSAALLERLKEDEADLARLRGDLEAATRENRPGVLPHPRVIEGFLSQLMALLETDQDRARVLLKRYMPPLVVTPLDGGVFKVTGGFDLEATLEPEDLPVRASSSRRDRD